MNVIQLAGSIVTLIGSLFLFLGALGILRMPDFYNRMQAGTKTTTLGSILTLLGIGIYHTAWLPQLVILIAFIVITNPISAHALARAAHFAGVPLSKKTVGDSLQDLYIEEADSPDGPAEGEGTGAG